LENDLGPAVLCGYGTLSQVSEESIMKKETIGQAARLFGIVCLVLFFAPKCLLATAKQASKEVKDERRNIHIN
jgi:hypothetical protein